MVSEPPEKESQGERLISGHLMGILCKHHPCRKREFRRKESNAKQAFAGNYNLEFLGQRVGMFFSLG